MTDFVPPRPWTGSYAEGVPKDLPPVSGSLVDLVEASAREHPRAPALEFFEAVTDYRTLLEDIERAAEGLRALGVRAGDRVAIVLPNAPSHIVAFYAVLRLGAIVVEHNPLYTAGELRRQFEDHRATTAIVWSKLVATLQGFADDVGVQNLVSVDVIRSMPAAKRLALRLPLPKAREAREALYAPVTGATPWSRLLKSERLDPEHPRPSSDDIAVLQYTSGTTGTPKGAALTHANLLANAAQARAWGPGIQRGEGCVVYAVLPMFHAYGLTLCLTFAMSMSARLVLFPRFDADMVLKVVRKRPATFLPLVPPIADRLLARATETGVSLEGIKIAISGAMALPHELVVPFEKSSSGYLVEGYGLSECSPVLMVNPVSPARRAGTIGLPFPGTECRIVDPENPSVDVAPGEAGELLVRGPQVFQGYYNKPEETAAVFVDGWFRTGDTARMDEAGFFRIVDRIKELIITGGFNVAPTEVETALRQHPDVVDAAVVGLPDGHAGEQVVAAVVLNKGASLDEDGIRSFARGVLTPYKIPKRVVAIDELPTSLIGKVQRREVRESLLARDTL